MRKIILSISIIILLLTGCSEEVNQQELINEYVKSNELVLTKIVNKINSEDEFDEENIIKELPKGIRISNVYKSEQYNYIRLGVDEGFTSFSHYYGFYYSPENEAQTIMALPGEKTEFKNGYRVQEPGNEDWYYTEKIVDNFYFYEAHY